MRKLLLILAMLCVAGGAWGATVYVRNSAAAPGTRICYKASSWPDASCTGGTDSSYFANASLAADNNGIIIVAAGTYVAAQYHSSGTAGLNIQKIGQTLKCITSDDAQFGTLGGTCTLGGAGIAAGDAIVDLPLANIRVTGFTFTGGSSNTPQVRCQNVAGAIIDNNTFLNATWGGVSYTSACTGFTHQQNKHIGVAGKAAHLTVANTSAGTIQYNLFGPSATLPGSFISHSSSGTSTIYNNDIIGSYMYGLLGSAGTVTVKNNVFAGNHAPGKTVYDVTTNGDVSITGGTWTFGNNYISTSHFQSWTELPIEGTYTDAGGNVILDGNDNTSASAIKFNTAMANKSFLMIAFDGDFFEFITPLAAVVKGVGGQMTMGMTGAIYNEGTKVNGTDGRIYGCILDHVSTTEDRPTTGANWETYWRLAPELASGVAWGASTSYTGYKTPLAAYLANGHGVMSHTRSHSEMNQTSAFDIQYIGTDNAPTIEIVASDTAPQIILTTTEGNDNVTITADDNTMMMNLPDLSTKIGFGTACTGACKWKLMKIVRNMSPTEAYYTTGFLQLTSLATLASTELTGTPLTATATINQTDTTSGFYKDEWVDWKAEADALLTEVYGSSFTINTAAQPFAQLSRSELSADQLGYVKTAGFDAFRYVSGGYATGVTNLDLKNINLYKIESIDVLSVIPDGITEAQAKARARLLANYMRTNPVFVAIHFHGLDGTPYPTSAIVTSFLNELKTYAPNVSITTFSEAISYIKNEANGWATTDNVTFTNATVANTANTYYQLGSSSPAINSGVSVGLTSDYASNPVPFLGGRVDVGAYEFQSGDPWTIGGGGRFITFPRFPGFPSQ